MDGLARVNAGVTSPAEFFSEANIAGIIAAAKGRPGPGAAVRGTGDSASNPEASRRDVEFIVRLRGNDPSVGCNCWPRRRASGAEGGARYVSSCRVPSPASSVSRRGLRTSGDDRPCGHASGYV